MTAGIDEALLLVAQHFKGMTDKDGQPYVWHCLRVMMAVTDPDARLVALMHDLVEDTPVTLDDLRLAGFAEPVLTALRLVTHREPDSYADYVVKIKADPIATQVKLADLRDNADLSRTLYRRHSADQDIRRTQKYILSYQFLTDRIDEGEYLQRMRDVE